MHPLSNRLPTPLCLALILMCLTAFATAQSDGLDALRGTSPLDTTSLLSPRKNASSTQLIPNTEFLPVEQAYQLTAERVSSEWLQLTWQIAEGYYLYQNKLGFAADSQQIQPELPPGIDKYDEYFEQELVVYYDSLQVSLELPENLHNATRFSLQVRSQGCADAGLCYPPQIQQLRIAGDHVEILDARIATLSGSTGMQSSGAGTGSFLLQLSLAFTGALLGGALLNLMPCVFPVLSLKALALSNAHLSNHRLHLHGWAYAAGSIALFVAIAAVMLFLRHAGYAVGWGFQLQSPVMVGALAYLFFVMGLLFSGDYNIGGSLAGAGQRLTEGHTPASSFFTGALACVVASPCTAPFMGSALGFAVTQPAIVALTVFAALGLGMALPFLLISYFPTLLSRLPKPGQWMYRFKQFLAYPLYLTALWLLWVLGRQAGSDAVILVGIGAVLIALALWLSSFHSRRGLTNLLITAVLALAAVPLFALRPDVNSHPTDTGSPWQPYSENALQEHLASGTPVFVNLTADWCITCLANERLVLSSSAVDDAFSRAGVVRMKGDWTNYNGAITDLLARFGRNGVPLYLLFPANGSGEAQVLPQILSRSALKAALAKLEQS